MTQLQPGPHPQPLPQFWEGEKGESSQVLRVVTR